MLNVLNNPILTLQLGILLGLMGRIVKGCVREVSLAQVSCILMYVYVAPPIPVGAWLMALGLRQHIEYYYITDIDMDKLQHQLMALDFRMARRKLLQNILTTPAQNPTVEEHKHEKEEHKHEKEEGRHIKRFYIMNFITMSCSSPIHEKAL